MESRLGMGYRLIDGTGCPVFLSFASIKLQVSHLPSVCYLCFHLYSTPLFPHIYMPSTSYLLFARPLPLTSKRNLLQGNSPLTEGNAAKLSSLQAPDYGLYFADLFRSIVCSVLLP